MQPECFWTFSRANSACGKAEPQEDTGHKHVASPRKSGRPGVDGVHRLTELLHSFTSNYCARCLDLTRNTLSTSVDIGRFPYIFFGGGCAGGQTALPTPVGRGRDLPFGLRGERSYARANGAARR